MLLNASEVFDPNAQARTILLAIEDATDRKQAEEALRTTNAELQHFAYALTHDLQEPLRMVVNFTELLGEECAGKLSGTADKYISYSMAGARRIETLLKACLPIGRLPSGNRIASTRSIAGLIPMRGVFLGRIQPFLPDGHGGGISPCVALDGKAGRGTERNCFP
jgi:signal transduction histidine kinase